MEHPDAVATAAAIAAREVSAAEVVDAAIARAEAVEATDPPLGAVVTETYGRARVVARGALSGPLAGVPTFVKDLDALAGVPTGYGSAALGGTTPRRSGAAVRELLATGLVALGTSAAPELGLTATTEPLHRPPTRNPWDPGHSAGGSSGGAAALVAAGVVPLAHATDGGGSIRTPSAHCGLVGLKPSYGRFVELETMRALPVRLAVSGVVTTTVRDTAAYLAAVERQHGRVVGLPAIGHVVAAGDRRLRVGVWTRDPAGTLLDRAVLGAVHRTADVLADLGHDVVDVEPPVGTDFGDAFLRYWGLLAQLAGLLGVRVRGLRYDPRRLEPWTRGLQRLAVREGVHLPSALRTLRRAPAAWSRLLGDVDVVLSPVTSAPAPPLGHLAPDLPFEVHLERVRALVSWNPLQNVVGAPAVALPLGRSGRLPVGVQLSAEVGDERTLLELALQLEAALPWPRTAPPWPSEPGAAAHAPAGRSSIATTGPSSP